MQVLRAQLLEFPVCHGALVPFICNCQTGHRSGMQGPGPAPRSGGILPRANAALKLNVRVASTATPPRTDDARGGVLAYLSAGGRNELYAGVGDGLERAEAVRQHLRQPRGSGIAPLFAVPFVFAVAALALGRTGRNLQALTSWGVGLPSSWEAFSHDAVREAPHPARTTHAATQQGRTPTTRQGPVPTIHPELALSFGFRRYHIARRQPTHHGIHG